jgi:hypothetical protein
MALLGLFPSVAHAITRDAVIDRAHVWVVKKVRYSQSSTFGGYRRDCSGFVSMAWKLGRSYTSRSIRAVATRIPLSKLQPGDAVHTPGHVAIFVKWANKAHGLYVAMEETHWGHPAVRRVRPLGHGASGLRYHHITAQRALVATVPLTGVSPIATAVADWTGAASAGIDPTVPAYATAASSELTPGAAAVFPSTDSSPVPFPDWIRDPTGSIALDPAY